ncbi:MAG: DEAD/DEAH box helicase [Mariprofundales bacterium]|nr:DEAD/DEAH box helicase [Mariprofundales bacterium]
MINSTNSPVNFCDLHLTPELVKALDMLGYEQPTPIQAETIPPLLAGDDVVGQAQTGTGKTASFALPMLARIDLEQKIPQVLVLAPTRELAIQVAEAFQQYASQMRGFHVLPIYGGQDYGVQLRALKRGVHVVVGTPGRIMDHMRRGTLELNRLQSLVLDEADEMLRMGFIDDVEWILQQTPESRQIALFSATMPNMIRRIAVKHLNSPKQITINSSTSTVKAIRQRFWMVSGRHKLDALTRIMEAESYDGVLIFVRTKVATVELAERLEARGYAAAPLNGDLNQRQREQTIDRLKKGRVDIVIATDVAARGLDVARISHVINYDIPHDTESYVHRIGRTGRAGRSGEAILFVAPREKRMLFAIERATKQRIDRLEMPTTEVINDRRIASFKQRITDTIAGDDLSTFQQIMESYSIEHDVPPLEVAAALAKMVQGDQPLLLTESRAKHDAEHHHKRRDPRGSGETDARQRDRQQERQPDMRKRSGSEGASSIRSRGGLPLISGMERFRVEVGAEHGVEAANIVGAIANEVGLEGEYIGPIEIHDSYSFVDLPEGMPRNIFRALKQVWVSGQKLSITKVDGGNYSEAGGDYAKKRPQKRRFRPGRSGSGRPSTHPSARKASARKPARTRHQHKG